MSALVRVSSDADKRLMIGLGRGSVRLHRRAVAVATILGLVLVGLTLLALAIGDYPLSLSEVLRAIVSDQGFDTRVVIEWRLPRVLAAVAFGAALGASGALFQTLTHNPLGSPDIIGFATGSYTGAIIAITIVGTHVASEMVGAVIGGLVTAFAIYVLAWRGGVQGFRLIIVGIAVTAVLSSVNTYLLLRAETEVAMAASIWGSGSLTLVNWQDLAIAVGPLALLLVATVAVVPSLRQLELGDDAANAHGVRPELTRLTVLVVGVALTAVVTAIVGPIAFIALAGPQIARRLAGTGSIPIGCAALTGAFLLLGADMLAQHVVPGLVPVGIVTVVIGGVYLIALLIQEARKQL